MEIGQENWKNSTIETTNFLNIGKLQADTIEWRTCCRQRPCSRNKKAPATVSMMRTWDLTHRGSLSTRSKEKHWMGSEAGRGIEAQGLTALSPKGVRPHHSSWKLENWRRKDIENWRNEELENWSTWALKNLKTEKINRKEKWIEERRKNVKNCMNCSRM